MHKYSKPMMWKQSKLVEEHGKHTGNIRSQHFVMSKHFFHNNLTIDNLRFKILKQSLAKEYQKKSRPNIINAIEVYGHGHVKDIYI